MPYCTQCGQQVAATAAFCGSCGARQAGVAQPGFDPFKNINSHTASTLCYIPYVGWIASIGVLATQRFREDRLVRFHAFQGLYLFVAWLILDWVLTPYFRLTVPHVFPFSIAKVMKAVLLVASIFMMVKTSQGRTWRLPIFGELAERSLSEQH